MSTEKPIPATAAEPVSNDPVDRVIPAVVLDQCMQPVALVGVVQAGLRGDPPEDVDLEHLSQVRDVDRLAGPVAEVVEHRLHQVDVDLHPARPRLRKHELEDVDSGKLLVCRPEVLDEGGAVGARR